MPALAAARILLRLPLRPAGAVTGRPRVTILLGHGYGMGGTIRSTLNLAGELARDHDVTVLSVIRRDDRPFFRIPAGVTLTPVDDVRPVRRSSAAKLLARLPSVLMHPDDRFAAACSLRTDLLLLRALRRVGGGVVIGTRPSLNLLAAQTARPAWSRSVRSTCISARTASRCAPPSGTSTRAWMRWSC